MVWRRGTEIYGGEARLFLDRIEPCDIKQGILGDCYFLSSIASIAEKEERIKKIFVSTDINKYGCYCVRICERGEWEEVIVDDVFPTDRNGKPIFTQGNGTELWVNLKKK